MTNKEIESKLLTFNSDPQANKLEITITGNPSWRFFHSILC